MVIAEILKVGPDLFARICEDPRLLDQLLFEEETPDVPGFDRDNDWFSEDYLHMFVPYFERLAEEAGHNPDDFEHSNAVMKHPMYRVITGDEKRPESYSSSEPWPDGDLNYEFSYGPAVCHGVEDVKALVTQWRRTFSDKDLTDKKRVDVALYEFCAQAAKDGRVLVCGIS